MLGLGLTTQQIIEILSAYAAPHSALDAVAETPGWHVLGAFKMPVTADELVLAAVGSVSHGDLTLRVRLFCISPGFVAAVTGSLLQITSTTDVEVRSGSFELTGGRLYQFQAEVIGGSGIDLFGIVESAAISNA